MDKQKLNSCINGTEGKNLLRVSLKKAQDANIVASPTIKIAGNIHKGGVSKDVLFRAICAAISGTKPAPCNNLPEPIKLQATVLTDKRCKKCETDIKDLAENLRSRFFPLLKLKTIYFSSAEGKELYKALGPQKLPIMLFTARVEKAEKYSEVKRFFMKKGKWRQVIIRAEFVPTAEADDITRLKTTWISIPGGSFRMGSRGEFLGDDEKPIHRVRVPSFQMLKTEVTVDQYQICVQSGPCTEPNSCSEYDNCDKSGRGNHPVNGVGWNQAKTFCEWVGSRLPSEAEWEYAARSGGKRWKYPWGNVEASCRRAVMDPSRGVKDDGCHKYHTWPVCSKTRGNSSQGLCDLMGNEKEWVEDCYHDSYKGAPSDGSAWTTECEGKDKVVRGGGWGSGRAILRASLRSHASPKGEYSGYGFRCARTVE